MFARDNVANMLTLHEVAERLDVHYMTAYRYVRLGLLPAVKSRGQWVVDSDDLSHFVSPREAAPPRHRSAPYAERFRSRAVVSDLKGAWAVCEAAMASGHSAEDVYLKVVGPALASIGDAWIDGQLTIADEHRATAVAVRTLGRLAHRLSRPGRTRETVIIGAPAGDTHSLPVTMAADILRGRGYDVVDLGAATPIGSFTEVAATAEAPATVIITVSAPDRTHVVRDTVAALREAVSDVRIFVGGSATGQDGYAEEVGADRRFGSVEAVVEHLESL